jgi:hypothetical protein
MTKRKPEPKAGSEPEIELAEDAWPRFEEFIKKAAKAGPKHRQAKNPADEPPKQG